MKQILYCLLFFSLVTCTNNNTNKVNKQNITGNWIWIKTVYHTGRVDKPTTIGANQELEFTVTGFVKTRRNGIRINQLPYFFEQENLFINNQLTAVKFKTDTLVLGNLNDINGQAFYLK